jgi:hypothetical protein
LLKQQFSVDLFGGLTTIDTITNILMMKKMHTHLMYMGFYGLTLGG